jgi:hypothetical protein
MPGMDFKLEGLQEQADYVEQVRRNILAGIQMGMLAGMEQLAGDVSTKLHGDPIGERTGDLLETVLRSPRVVTTEAYIKGEVSTAGAKFRNLGLWLEFGTGFPKKGKGLAQYPKQFLPGNSESAKSAGHGAFRIAPRPFFNPTFQEDYPTILETINQRIAEACA